MCRDGREPAGRAATVLPANDQEAAALEAGNPAVAVLPANGRAAAVLVEVSHPVAAVSHPAAVVSRPVAVVLVASRPSANRWISRFMSAF